MPFTKTRSRIVPIGVLGMLTFIGAGCTGGGDDDGDQCKYNDPAGADCASCQQLGQCCEFSINCPAGAICNVAGDALFDGTKESNICLKVVCQGDSDCEAPKTCSLEKLCKPPVCQTDAECPGGQRCLSGTCNPAPKVEDVDTCEVVTRSTSIRQGATLDLAAVARNRNGAVLPTIEFVWSSANENVVSVMNAVATGGTQEGTTSLTAAVNGRADVTCAGSVSLTNFPNVPQGSARVVLVADDDGTPVAGAQVVFEAGGTFTTTTSANGSATVQVGGAVDSVTIMKANWQTVSVLQPGTNDIFVPLPRVPNETVAGGFRGKVDLSATRKADIQLGIAGPAIPSNLLDFGLDALIGDAVNTTIDAPELGLDNEMVDLPGGVMIGLGTKKFTADGSGVRCQGDTVGDNEIGCYLARAPKGPAAGWVLAGQLKLSQVTSIANELSNAIGGNGEDINIGSILTAVLPLVRSLNHGVIPALNVEEFPKINTPTGMGDCTNRDLASYDDNCQADFTKYQDANVAASQSLGVLSRVSVPDLPQLPRSTDCAAGAILLTGVNLEGRGLVPLGLTAGVDVLDMETPDCKIGGVDKPFGDNSPALRDGQLPLSMAPPHSGIEGSQLFVLLLALDPNSIAADDGFQLNAIVQRVDSIAEEHTVTGSYLSFPEATLDKAAGSVALDSAISGAALFRLELQRGDDTWLVYAPASATNVTLPTVSEPRQILAGVTTAYVLGMGMNGTYSDVWTFGSGKTLNRMFDTATGFVVQQCSTEAAAPCVIQ